jgi:hypothetical protein
MGLVQFGAALNRLIPRQQGCRCGGLTLCDSLIMRDAYVCDGTKCRDCQKERRAQFDAAAEKERCR